MGTTKQVGKLLLDITPSFREARKIRNEIKSHYRKNVRNIKSDRPVKTYIGTETQYLGNTLEDCLMELEVKMANAGQEKKRGGTRVSASDRQKTYAIDEGHEKELKEDMEKFIAAIVWRNRISIFLESSIYLLIFGIIVLLAIVLSSNILRILM